MVVPRGRPTGPTSTSAPPSTSTRVAVAVLRRRGVEPEARDRRDGRAAPRRGSPSSRWRRGPPRRGASRWRGARARAARRRGPSRSRRPRPARARARPPRRRSEIDARARVERVLDELLHDGRRALDHLARGDLVHEPGGQDLDARHRALRSTGLRLGRSRRRPPFRRLTPRRGASMTVAHGRRIRETQGGRGARRARRAAARPALGNDPFERGAAAREARAAGARERSARPRGRAPPRARGTGGAAPTLPRSTARRRPASAQARRRSSAGSTPPSTGSRRALEDLAARAGPRAGRGRAPRGARAPARPRCGSGSARFATSSGCSSRPRGSTASAWTRASPSGSSRWSSSSTRPGGAPRSAGSSAVPATGPARRRREPRRRSCRGTRSCSATRSGAITRRTATSGRSSTTASARCPLLGAAAIRAGAVRASAGGRRAASSPAGDLARRLPGGERRRAQAWRDRYTLVRVRPGRVREGRAPRAARPIVPCAIVGSEEASRGDLAAPAGSRSGSALPLLAANPALRARPGGAPAAPLALVAPVRRRRWTGRGARPGGGGRSRGGERAHRAGPRRGPGDARRGRRRAQRRCSSSARRRYPSTSAGSGGAAPASSSRYFS